MQNAWRQMNYAGLGPRVATPVAWLTAVSKHPTVSRIVYPLYWLSSFVLTILARTAFITIPLYLFRYIYLYFWDYWTFYFPDGLFLPAWPTPRTRLVVLMATVPTWGVCMAVGVVLWAVLKVLFAFSVQWVARRRRGGGDYELASPTEHLGARKRTQRRRPALLWMNVLWLASFFGFVSLALSGLYMFETYEFADDYRYKRDIELALREPKQSGYHDGTKVFVAVMFNNNIDILPYWIKEFTKVIYYLGSDNVFISIVEGNSWDGTAEMLDDWKGTLDGLGVRHRILTRDKTVTRPADMSTGPGRIQFLSDTRNLALAPLVEHGGYDVVLFSNDVLIEAESVVELLKTKNGEWDMVCGLDMGRWGLYDAWVIRDRLGRLVSSLWPYFLEDAGMEAVMHDEPAPVFTCWNGIVAFRADPMLPPSLRTPGGLSTAPLSRPLPETHPAYPQPAGLTPAATPPLKFRLSGDKECFSSESFNFPYDLRRQFDMQRIYLNPRVINAYEWKYYVWWKWITRHWVVRWWMRDVEKGNGMQFAKMVIGDAKRVWTWDGGECHPW
ncbi:cryptococcal mannosyltransferase 1-domain-containing protein [Mycena metata]|uniref:Cryptococcal mannosyltransferase 1-domain-containing protein n=1 Tax=Mycena metata TaxID=1033252 RepID=A0AAD7J841_9AGAR|nr:cryptococcal mannosyltransferase 1-domain-containing protein [Mycena metata]